MGIFSSEEDDKKEMAVLRGVADRDLTGLSDMQLVMLALSVVIDCETNDAVLGDELRC